jgi:hypothetical protein
MKKNILMALCLSVFLFGCSMTEEEKKAQAEKRCYVRSECWQKLPPEDKKWVAEQWEAFERNNAERWANFRQERAIKEQQYEMDKMKRELEEAQRQLEDAEWRARFHRYR